MQNSETFPALPAEIVVLQPQIAALCQQYGVLRLSLFGSRARGDGRPDSDYDFVVKFDTPPYTTPDRSLFARTMDFYHYLKLLLQADVHLLDEGPIKNIYVRESIENSKVLVYTSDTAVLQSA